MSYSAFKITLALMGAFSLFACANPEIVSSRKSKALTQPINSMLVIAKIGEEDLRHMTENWFSTILQDRGVNAVASHRVFPDMANFNKEKVEEKSRELELEGFLIIRILAKEQLETEEPNVHQPNPYGYNPAIDPFSRGAPHFIDWHSYYSYGNPYVRTSSESTHLRLETNLYQPAGPGLVWSSIVDASSYIDTLEEEMIDIIDRVVKKLEQDKAI